MSSFAKIYMADGEVITIGSMPGERLDIGFSGGYVTVGRGLTCQFKKNMADVTKIIFLNDFRGPDLELSIRGMALSERADFFKEQTTCDGVSKDE